ncbi:hypothetical protein QJV03_04785 [Listeria swaminathanii]|uniref:Uncharacterized protein n=1 Tax=Listeria swaminathanii TaxID=2713501 RepID=A0ABU2IBY9_9LIST|nr:MULTISPECIES: hypothetical protein [Listeria]MDT0013344.1 hypothetical protein [Listeria cossartiae subsp. cayugensis]MDT0016502.1 hypothetical protein [Listeria swaminathanii]MDT0021938.1 hypothetical protein [Listeria swaminathanii]MDT0032902.1 hypothetical protein [Listeria swaminathanii]MDT0051248.1 hypothetical protein [Listeria swaminathanii]
MYDRYYRYSSKNLILSFSTALVIYTIIYGAMWIDDRTHAPGMIQVDGIVYVMEGASAKKENAIEKIGEIKQNISRYRKPKKDFTSNSLEEGAELYKVKYGEFSPKTILYKENDKLYIAVEVEE